LRFWIATAALLGCASFAGAQIPSDWERENAERLKQSGEQAVTPPALDRSRLVELKLEREAGFRYFLDAASVSVGADRIVRYTLVARSPSGVENISFEGLRCPGEYRIYAVGRPDGGWGGRPSAWRAVPRDERAGQRALSKRYFCPGRAAIRSAEEGVGALRAGGHPGVFLDEY
jgi:hypothetical protein